MSAVPVGVVLAGGRARRLHGRKAAVALGGRPLLSYPLRAMLEATVDVAIVAKPSTELPPLGAVPVWEEPEQPSHPLVGIVEALRRAGGRPVLVCAGDMPFVPAALLARLAAADAGGSPAIVATSDRHGLQPLLGRYEPAALELLAPAAAEAVAPVRAVVAGLGPVVVAVDEPCALFNVNTPEDLREAEELLAARG